MMTSVERDMDKALVWLVGCIREGMALYVLYVLSCIG